MTFARTIVIASLLAITATAALAQRAALVIGNSAYQHAAPLPVSVGDARAMAQKLRSLGFVVTEGYDLDFDGLRDIQREFASTVGDAEVLAVFYSGHTFNVADENYIVPTDATLSDAIDWEWEVFPLTEVLVPLASSQAASLVILDAPRLSPQIDALAIAMRELDPGLPAASVGVAPTELASNGGVVFLTADTVDATPVGANRRSALTEALLNNIATPNTDITTVTSSVTGDVLTLTGGARRPLITSSLTGRMILNEVAAPAAAAPQAMATAAPQSQASAPDPTANLEIQMVMFQAAQASQDINDYREYEKNFPNGVFAQQVRNAIGRLEQDQVQAEPDTQVAAVAPQVSTRAATPLGDDLSQNAAITELPVFPTVPVTPAIDLIGPLVLTATPALINKPATQQTETEMALTRTQKREVQGRLNALGHNVGAADGAWGPKTRAGLSAWQSANGLVPTTFLNASQFELLRASSEAAYQAAPVPRASSSGSSKKKKRCKRTKVGPVTMCL